MSLVAPTREDALAAAQSQPIVQVGKKWRCTDGDESSGNSEDDSDEDVYRSCGRAFARLGDPGFVKIFQIVEQAINMIPEDSEDENDRELTERETRMAESWAVLTKIIPGFKALMFDPANATRRLWRRKLCKSINAGVCDARSDDTAGLKFKILNWLLEDITVKLLPPIPNDEEIKSLRGWNHPVTARLLTPLDYLADDNTYASVKAGRVKVTAEMWPRFLYAEGREYKPDDEESGLFMGHLMIRATKHIFMGPSSALKGPGYCRGTHCNARRINMNVITPRALAYVAVQVRFAISDAEKWATVDRQFSLAKFYWNVVAFFDDGEGQDVLDFYNHELFGETRQLQGLSDDLSDDPDSNRPSASERMKAQRAQKRARLAAPTTPAAPTGMAAPSTAAPVPGMSVA
ncbi:hypothetical protein EUX98_g8668 [Antrodiella citrinella]|uniref:Fungal-type protein kinase domain-containing protein n=1 Tax=Antrodiella citrinella TaxID=2447956 RepID=A0A4S4M4B6_9APHY|nr:hypothetical protein EUX98_g8668 [Antrodiella citrinella]